VALSPTSELDRLAITSDFTLWLRVWFGFSLAGLTLVLLQFSVKGVLASGTETKGRARDEEMQYAAISFPFFFFF
jgi:hypothetical protein